MTYEEIFEKSKERLLKAKTKDVKEFIAVQFNIFGEGQGSFYAVIFDGKMDVAFHSAELWYMFGTLDRSRRPFTAEDHALSEEMLEAWTSFCRTGDPGWDAYKHDKPFKKLFDIHP